MPKKLNVAVIQSPGCLVGPQARVEWLAKAMLEHANQPYDLVVLPELFQSGYCIGDKVTEHAESSDGPFAMEVAKLAQKHDTAILYGYSERQGHALFNSAQCIEKSGRVIGHHRKLILPPGFEGSHFTPGKICKLFDIDGFKVGILICYDLEFPENLRHMALQGADLVVVPTALGAQWGVVSEKVVPTRAFENGIYICYANSSGHENGMEFFGGSCIVSPDGLDIVRAGNKPELLCARIEKSAVAAAKERLPYLRDRQKLPWV